MKREKWLDISRGIVMIMVILGHTGSYLIGKGLEGKSMSIYFMVTSAIKIPGFFAISGYLFHDKHGDTWEFIKNKIMKILLPYFTLGAVNMLLNILITWGHIKQWTPWMQHYVHQYIKKFILGKNLWFIPCLFSVEIIFFIVKKLTKSNLFCMGIVSSILCIIGYIWSVPEVYIPWRIDTAFMCVLFVYIGYAIRNVEAIRNFVLSKKGLGIFSILYLMLGIFSYLKYGWKNMDVNRTMYYNFILCFAMIIVGIVVLFGIGKLINKNKILEFVGQNTLAYFIFHTFFFKFAVRVLNRIKIYDILNYSISCAILASIIAMILMVPLIMFINKYCPMLVGKNRRKK